MEREGKGGEGGEGGEEGGGGKGREEREGKGGDGKVAVLALSSRQWHVVAAAPHNGPKTHSVRGAAVCRPARKTSGYSTFFSRYKLHRYTCSTMVILASSGQR